MSYFQHFPPISFLFPHKVCMPSQALHQFLFSCEPGFQDNKDWCLSSYHRVLLSKKYRAKSTARLSLTFQISLLCYICTLCWKPSWWSSLFSHIFLVKGVYLTIFTTDSKPSACEYPSQTTNCDPAQLHCPVSTNWLAMSLGTDQALPLPAQVLRNHDVGHRDGESCIKIATTKKKHCRGLDIYVEIRKYKERDFR